MQNSNSLEILAKDVLKSILKDSGHLLYSSSETIRQGSIYLLGHNPGGSPEGRDDESIERSIKNLSRKTSNEYVDDSWNGLPPGTSTLQKRVCWLVENLRLNVREVCASNLVFSRSVDAASSNFDELANICWPVHEFILGVVRPALILTFGNSDENSPYAFIKEKLGGKIKDELYPSGHGNWQCKAFVARNSVMVVGLPHLNRYAIDHHEDVPQWITRICPLSLRTNE